MPSNKPCSLRPWHEKEVPGLGQGWRDEEKACRTGRGKQRRFEEVAVVSVWAWVWWASSTGKVGKGREGVASTPYWGDRSGYCSRALDGMID